MSSEVVARFDNETLASVASFDDAVKLLESAGIGISDVADLIGDGFAMVEKKTLINIPFLIFDSKIVESGEHGSFSVVRVVTSDNRKCVITDGSTGIHRQMQQMHGRGIVGGVICKGGLTVSEYDHVDEKGEVTAAKTYYVAL